MSRTSNSLRWRVITAYLNATPSRSTPPLFCKGLLLAQHRHLTPQSTHFLLGRLARNGGPVFAIAPQLPRPPSQLVWPHIELTAHLRQCHPEGASLRYQAHRFGFELGIERAPLSSSCDSRPSCWISFATSTPNLGRVRRPRNRVNLRCGRSLFRRISSTSSNWASAFASCRLRRT